jgi:hypothetical protein
LPFLATFLPLGAPFVLAACLLKVACSSATGGQCSAMGVCMVVLAFFFIVVLPFLRVIRA